MLDMSIKKLNPKHSFIGNYNLDIVYDIYINTLLIAS